MRRLQEGGDRQIPHIWRIRVQPDEPVPQRRQQRRTGRGQQIGAQKRQFGGHGRNTPSGGGQAENRKEGLIPG